MADKVRNRKEILEKVSNNQTLNLDGSAVLFASRLEQDEFISYARSEIERQRNIWRVSHSRFHHSLVLLHGADRCVHLRLPVRNDGGRVGHLPERGARLDSRPLPLLHGSPVSQHLHHAVRCHRTPMRGCVSVDSDCLLPLDAHCALRGLRDSRSVPVRLLHHFPRQVE